MIPISSLVFSRFTHAKGKRGRSYELNLDGEVVGRMERPSFWSCHYAVETADGRWTFRQSGLGKAEIIDESSQQTIATMKPHWGAGGPLTFADGQKFDLSVQGWWRPVWAVTPESGEPVLRLHARDRSLEMPARAGGLKGRLLLLAMFAYYRILKAEEDAAAGAVVAAIS